MEAKRTLGQIYEAFEASMRERLAMSSWSSTLMLGYADDSRSQVIQAYSGDPELRRTIIQMNNLTGRLVLEKIKSERETQAA